MQYLALAGQGIVDYGGRILCAPMFWAVYITITVAFRAKA
jgi:hypothetical protein